MPNQSIRLVFAAILALVGLLLGFGGTWLVLLGGSPFYLVQGLAFVAIGILVWICNPLRFGLMPCLLVSRRRTIWHETSRGRGSE